MDITHICIYIYVYCTAVSNCNRSSKTWAHLLAFVTKWQIITMSSLLCVSQAGEERGKQCLIRNQGPLGTPRACGRKVPWAHKPGRAAHKNHGFAAIPRYYRILVPRKSGNSFGYGRHLFFWGIRRQQERRERSSFWQVIVLEAWAVEKLKTNDIQGLPANLHQWLRCLSPMSSNWIQQPDTSCKHGWFVSQPDIYPPRN